MMKKWTTAILTLFVVLSVFAQTAVLATEPLTIATFQADVTPPIGSPLCNGYRAVVKRVDLPLTARGVVLLVEPAPIVLCAVDWVIISNAGHDAWRDALARAANTTVDRVTVHSVHPHDAPGCDFSAEEELDKHGLSGKMFNVKFARVAIDRTAKAVRDALGKAVTITHLGVGQAKVEKVASNRRILGPDGKVKYGRMSSCRDKTVRDAPEGVIDPYVKSLSFWNGDQPIVCMSYYATHPQCNYGHGGASPEIAGMARLIRERELPGVGQIYFNGAGGDIAVGKYNDGSKGNRKILAGRLAKGIRDAWRKTKRVPISAADIKWRVLPVALPPSKRLDEALAVKTLSDPNAKLAKRVFAARDLGFLRRVKAGRKIDLTCLRLGSVYVLHMPGELSIYYQLAAQKMKAGSIVCMAAYSDLGPGYICPRIAYRQGGYEAGHVSRVSPDVEDVLMTAMGDLLR